MNLGFFVQTNGGTPINTQIFNFLNSVVDDPKIRDASVFFNDVAFNPVNPKFAMFNSADIWNFKGNLICDSVDNLRKAVSAVNDIKLAYLFSGSEDIEKHIFDFIGIAKSTKVAVTNEVDQNTFFRLTGSKPVLIKEWSIEKVEELFNE